VDHGVSKTRGLPGLAFAIISAVLLVLVGTIIVRALTTTRMPPIVAVARFDNETGDPSFDRFADTLTDTVTLQLAEAGAGRFRVIGNAAILRVPRQQRDMRAIAASLNAGFIVLGQIQRDDLTPGAPAPRNQRVRVLAHLIRMPDQTHIKVSRTEDVAGTTLSAADEIAARIARAFSQAAVTH
jgi:TolB-like protein